MNLFQKLVRDYENRTLQDDGAYRSKDFNTFARKTKNAIKKFCEEEGISLASFTVGHYYLSGFLNKGRKYVYFAYDIRRGLPLDFDRDDALCGVLVREADGPKDYIGHANHFCAFRNFEPYIKTFFEKNFELNKLQEVKIMDEKMMLNFIPVTEQCPEEDGFVLVRKKDKSVTIAQYLANEDGDWWEDTVGAEIPYDDILEWAEMPFNWQLPNPHKAQREGYEEQKKEYAIEDIEGQIDQMELSNEEIAIIEEIPRDLLYERFEKALSNNDCYWEAYWQTMDDVIKEEIRNEQGKRANQE